MDVATLAAVGYGVLAIVGGVIGYAKARSQASLISGLVSGGLLIGSGIAHQQNLPWGVPLAVGVTIALVGVFVMRLVKTRKFMPAGLMVIAGVIALAGLLGR